MPRGWIAEVRATASPAPAGRLLAEIAPFAIRAVAWSSGLAVIFLAWRRLAGALVDPPNPPLLLAIGLAAATLAALCRRFSHSARFRSVPGPAAEFVLHPSSFILHPFLWLPAVLLATLAAALSFAATPWPARLSFWGLLILEEAWTLWPRTRAGDAAKRSLAMPPPAVPAAIAASPAGEVVQQLTRSQAADGSELLTGFLRLAFAPGQRTASVHVAFCPPFKSAPRLEVRQCEGPSARVKTVQLLPYGARLDLKLAAPTDKPLAVLLQFSARWDPGDRQ